MSVKLLLGLLLFSCGCSPSAGPKLVGADDSYVPSASGPGNGSQAARSIFVTKVYPAITSTCASCHATGASNAPIYLSRDGASPSYDALQQVPGLIAAPQNSQLLLHGVHTGPPLTFVQRDIVTNWLTAEVSERNLTVEGGVKGTGSLSAATALAQFGNCMDYGQWIQSGLDQIAAVETQTAGACTGCHSQGEGGNYLNAADSTKTFNNMRTSPYVKRLVTATVDANGGFKDLAPSHRLVDKGTEATECAAADGGACHPVFEMPPDLVLGLTDFVSATLDRWHARACGDGGVSVP